MVKKKTFLIIIIITTLVSVLLSSLITYNISNPSNNFDDNAEDSMIGTFEVENENNSFVYYLAIINDAESKKEYVFYSSDDKIVLKGNYEIDNNSIVVMYEDKNIYANLILSNGNYYFIKTGEKAKKIIKKSDNPIVP